MDAVPRKVFLLPREEQRVRNTTNAWIWSYTFLTVVLIYVGSIAAVYYWNSSFCCNKHCESLGCKNHSSLTSFITCDPEPESPETADPEAHMTMPEVVAYHGYPLEQYRVKSQDGYYTWIQRIPRGKHDNDTSTKKRIPIIVQHGLMGLSSVWVVNIPALNLAYYLADNGYDVWLTNSRGNAYSLKHEKYTKSNKAFWVNADWNEMGQYDIPTFVDFILEKTGHEQLLYVGHSMGTTMALVALSTRPEYNSKVKGVFLLAPVARLDHMKGEDFVFNLISKAVELLTNVGVYYLDLNSPVLNWLLEQTCKFQDKTLCKVILLAYQGEDTQNLNVTRAPVFTHLQPSSCSVYTYLHYGQVRLKKRFQMYDYGWRENLKIYKKPTPPEYNLTAITAPVWLYTGDKDGLATTADAQWLATQLPNIKLNMRVPDPNFNHLDFMWGMNVMDVLYPRLLKDIKSAWSP